MRRGEAGIGSDGLTLDPLDALRAGWDYPQSWYVSLAWASVRDVLRQLSWNSCRVPTRVDRTADDDSTDPRFQQVAGAKLPVSRERPREAFLHGVVRCTVVSSDAEREPVVGAVALRVEPFNLPGKICFHRRHRQ